MALASYADLQAAVANYLARPGDANITTPAPDFVTLAESRIAYGSEGQWPCRPLRIRAMETAAVLITGAMQTAVAVTAGSANAQTVPLTGIPTLTPGLSVAFTAGFSNSGAMTLDLQGSGPIAIKKGVPQTDLAAGDVVAGGSYTVYYDGSVLNLVPRGGVPLPAGFLQMKSIYLQTSPIRPLSPVTPEIYNATFLSTGTGQPRAYDLEGDCIRLGPAPDAAYGVAILFYRKFPTLSGGANWLFANKPDIYLFATLMEAAIFLGTDQDIAKFFGLYCGAAESLQSQDAYDRYSGAVLQIRSGIRGA
jgi:hypothetical protein